MQIGVVFKGVETPAYDVNAPLVRDAAHVVARPRQRFAPAPCVGFRVIDFMPANAGPLIDRGRSTAYEVNFVVQYHGCRRTTRARQGRDALPFV